MEIASDGELHAVRVEMAEEILARAGIGQLRGVRGVDRDPAAALHVELRPAVIAGDVAVRGGERKADDEARRDALRARQREKQRVKVRAVALLDVAGALGVAVA